MPENNRVLWYYIETCRLAISSFNLNKTNTMPQIVWLLHTFLTL